MGRDAPPADADCSAGSASAVAVSAAHWLPAPSRRCADPRALTGLRRRPRASRGVHGASGPASPAAAPPRKWTPAAGPGRPFHPRCRPEGGQTSSGHTGPRGAAGGEAPAPGATAAEPAGTGPQSRPWPPDAGLALRGPVCGFSRTKFSGTRCHPCFPMAVRGGLDFSSTWCKNCLTQKSGLSSPDKGH